MATRRQPLVIEGGDEITDERIISRDWMPIVEAAQMLQVSRQGFVDRIERPGSGWVRGRRGNRRYVLRSQVESAVEEKN